MFTNLRLPFIIVLAFFSLSSCVNSRSAVYFFDQKDATLESTTIIPENVIQKNDVLGISVSSLNPTASAIFNAPNNAASPPAASFSGANQQSGGYLVDAQGNIQFPVLGNISAAGMTGNQLREWLVRSLTEKKLLVDPIVTVRFLNFKVTVLGEVNNPTVVNVSNEKITLLEALGLAGDLTIYGKRDNVMVIREVGSQKTIKRINLNTSELFNSPYYYLKSNDIVYVEPSKTKISSASRSGQVLPLVLNGLSFAVIVMDRLLRQ
jgi:polysaccharide export outer membrane protein